ncbi:MAG TPA: ankyrin repeat domain-containing protein, partial [Candidatus Wallbacteria bacterium]|nr:ankyrin repeat domain-containing protein [Candidatus Wallbacteria bacterium]
NNGVSALIQAVASESFEMVELLIRHGADVNDENKSGWTVLRLANEKGCEKIIRLLEEAGAKI